MSERQLLQAIAVTAEMTGTQLSPAASRAMFEDLKGYPEHQVMGALVACRRQLQHRLTLADVLARLDDGRPGPEEAWATVMQSKNEAVTLVWTDEMRMAGHFALPLLMENDLVAARMTFTEVYRRLVQRARDEGRPVEWGVSLGHDASGREGPIREAIERGRLAAGVATQLLPPPEAPLPKRLAQELASVTEKLP